MFGRVKRIHLVGIGGSGMSGIAMVLANMGFDVSGSDIRASETTERLMRAGVRVAIGHDAVNVADAEVVVYSSAVKADNPELVQARSAKIPVIRRAEMLAELMRLKFAVAIAGSHGKTTVTSLVAHILERAGLDPTCVVGGRVISADSGGKLGTSQYLVAEADESDRSFLALYPTIAVITNVEREHLDVYRDLADIKREFVRFANRVPFYGAVVLCVDSPAVRGLRARVARRTITYSVQGGADFGVRDVQYYGLTSAFTVTYRGREVGRFTVPLAGVHNVANCLAAIAVANELGVEFGVCEQALRVFSGVHRRLERVGERDGVLLFDDYGHHPTEIRVTLEALRQAFPDRRLIVAFQPHRYSRTRLLADEFGSAFVAADLLALTSIYPASEPEIPGVDATLIKRAVERQGNRPEVVYLPELDELANWLGAQVRPGDVVLTLGAGNIWMIGQKLLASR